MVVGAFPAAKLGILALKQISKPIANVLKNRAKNNPFFRTYICMPPAQFYNWVEVKTKMWAMNLGKPMKVPQLNEAMAIELGANLLGEFVIFTIGAGLLIFEYVRQSKKESKKEEQVLEEKAALQNALDDMAFRIEKQDTQIRELRRILYSMENKSWIRLSRPASDSDVLKELDEPPSKQHSNKSMPLSANTPSTSNPQQSSMTAPPSSREDLKKTFSESKENVKVNNTTTGSSRTL